MNVRDNWKNQIIGGKLQQLIELDNALIESLNLNYKSIIR